MVVLLDAHLNDLDESICAPPGKDKHKLSKKQKRGNMAARLSTNQMQRKISDFTSKELAETQEADESLARLWKLAEDGNENYYTKDSILYHSSEDQLGKCSSPTALQKRSYQYSSHITDSSPPRCKEDLPILRDFYWPCHSCEECQKGAKKNQSKAPLTLMDSLP